MNSKIYWDKKIIEWEDSMKGNANISFIEKLASLFRNPLKRRAELSMNILKPFAKNKTVLELGCGSGFFAFELYRLGEPKQIIGIDISSEAIKRAQSIAQDKGLTDKIKFTEMDVVSTKLPESDITIGLGFLDYLSDEEIQSLFKNMKSQYFLFTFSEKRISLLRYIHIFYLLSQKCPKHFYYTKKELSDCIGKRHGKIKFISHRKLSFGVIVHNLPESP